MNEPRIRTLLIEDSSFMQRIIGDLLQTDSSIDLVGTASNGKEGVQLAMDLRPDVVITDMVMPDYDGMYVVRAVMENNPVPIILLSSLDKGNSRIFDALQNGAFEFIDKPSGFDSISMQNYQLLNLVKYAASADISLLKVKQPQERRRIHFTFNDKLNYEIIAIGASTGGPSAVESIIQNLPVNLSVPVVIVQHMPARFLETFAARLHAQSAIPVKLATKGLQLKSGYIYIAPGDANVKIERGPINPQPIFTFSNEEFEEFNNPSINCLFESVAEIYGQKSMGVILTGMGKDGMNGLRKIKAAGGYTIAQDEESSVVYGMPKAAVEANAVKKVLSLHEIPGFIIDCL
jgi:two-component system, chemotaxis family, protein-glutamate methylesterase/glutaminase